MKKLICALAFPLILGACQTTQPDVVVTTKYYVPDIPVDLIKCPPPKNIPNADTLTDEQVAKFVVQVYGNNKLCRNSIKAIQNYLAKVKQQVETDQLPK